MTNDPLDDFIANAAHALGLPVEPSWQPAVKFNLQVILRQATLCHRVPSAGRRRAGAGLHGLNDDDGNRDRGRRSRGHDDSG